MAVKKTRTYASQRYILEKEWMRLKKLLEANNSNFMLKAQLEDVEARIRNLDAIHGNKIVGE